jgi:hypothetical protein
LDKNVHSFIKAVTKGIRFKTRIERTPDNEFDNTTMGVGINSMYLIEMPISAETIKTRYNSENNVINIGFMVLMFRERKNLKFRTPN